MSKSIKLSNNMFIDSKGVDYKHSNLETVLDGLMNSLSAEIGSNSNGEYIKFSNGILICYYYGVETTVTANQVYTWTKAYPYNFISRPIIIPCIGSDSGSYSDFQNITYYSDPGATNTSCKIRIFRGSGSSRNPVISYIALGKWK